MKAWQKRITSDHFSLSSKSEPPCRHHGQRGERVLKYLLEGEEFENTQLTEG
jgi:hypothetical protein